MTTFKRDFVFRDNVIEVVARNVKKYREENNYTIKELAEYTKIQESFLENFENAYKITAISIYDLYKISVVLNVSIDKFFQ